MATQYLEVTGTALWAKVFERNRDMNMEYHGKTDGACTITLCMEKEELDKVTRAGVRAKPRLMEDGTIAMSFKRPFKNEAFPDLGGAPIVEDADKNLWDQSVDIGNDSKVTLFLDVYDTKMGKGTRLRGLRVLELVPYEGPKFTENGLPY